MIDITCLGHGLDKVAALLEQDAGLADTLREAIRERSRRLADEPPADKKAA